MTHLSPASSAAADELLTAHIEQVRSANPDLWWGGWWNPTHPHPDGLLHCRDAMTSAWGKGQFRRALAFIEQAPRTRGINPNVSCYGWKHRAERMHRLSGAEHHYDDYYVGEGMFIAAAIASGLLIRRRDGFTYVNLSSRAGAQS
jgi:hypothetical protein